MTTELITAETGFNPSTVRCYLRQAGIPIRPVRFIKQYDIKKKELSKLRRPGGVLRRSPIGMAAR
jgi:hypothetical protein